MTTIFTVQIEFSYNDGQIWQATEFPERVEAKPGETAEDIAELTASHQNQSDDSDEWRVVIWDGDDTCADPVHVLYGSGR